MMDSPFTNNSTFVVYVEPIRNNYHKTYQNILTVNIKPPGPLEAMVKAISLDKLSPFEKQGGMMCTHVILRYPRNSVNSSLKNLDTYMTTEDIPALLSYLQENNYEVDTSMTKMLQKSRVSTMENRRMVCIVKQL